MSDTAKKHAAINPWSVAPRIGSDYPPPFDELCSLVERHVLGELFGLTQFGVNLVRLPPGQGSAQRHWHRHEDEFVMVLRGKVTLVTDAGEQEFGPGMVAGFKAGVEDGHHLVNRSDQDAVYLEVGTRAQREECVYPDIDLHYVLDAGGERYTRKDGAPFDE